MKREEFLKSLGLLTAGVAILPGSLSSCTGKSSGKENSDSVSSVAPSKQSDLFFKLSLAEWALHRAIFGGHLPHVDFPLKAKKEFGITAVEYVNQFFMDKANDKAYLEGMKQRCDDNGITSVLIMCDHEGDLGHLDAKQRKQAVENHYKWVEAAQFLSCQSIRVNAYGQGPKEEVAKAAAEGLTMLCNFAKDFGLNVIVENHGGYSSDGKWLSGVIKAVNLPNCGTLPDFSNFCIKTENDRCAEEYNKYQGIEELMPFAKGVSAKTFNFDDNGNCIETDYPRMLSIIKRSGYTGYIGVEYEGDSLSEDEGIRKTIALLKRVGSSLS